MENKTGTGSNDSLKSRNLLQKTALMLVNLGSPLSPSERDVRHWLSEFLMDPRVVDLPWLVRKILVSGVIAPFRSARTAKAYSSIWTDSGSPLLVNTRKLASRMSDHLNFPVTWAMRYGKPGMADSIRSLADQQIKRLVLVPLYPQYAASTVQTVVEEAMRCNRELDAPMELVCLPPFYRDSGYIECLVRLIREKLDEETHLLLSYHGLPESALRRACPEAANHCLASEDCCDQPSPAHNTCYRHQSMATSRKIVEALGLPSDRWQASFQSRLGRIPWLRPYTDEVLASLPARNIRRLCVVCPSFVADNLETLEEINIAGRQSFLKAGGEDFCYIACLNDDESWALHLSRMCQDLLVADSINELKIPAN